MADGGRIPADLLRGAPGEEYIALCRHLNLPREWQPGDAAWYPRAALDDMEAEDMAEGVYHIGDHPEEWEDDRDHWTALGIVWLPRASDWFDLIEACGFPWLPGYLKESPVLNRIVIDYVVSGAVHALRAYGGELGIGPDLLTALCRLYMAVKGSSDD